MSLIESEDIPTDPVIEEPAGAGEEDTSKGIVKVLLTDCPLKGKEVLEVWINIQSVEIHSEEQGWQTVVDNRPGGVEYDLLELVDNTALVGLQHLDAGHYTQIRLVLDRSNRIIIREGTEESEHALTIPSCQNTGIKLNGDFEITAGGTTEIVLDFIAAKSIVLTGKGKYILKPVVKIKEVRQVHVPDPTPPTVLYAGTSNPGMVYAYDGSSWTSISGTLDWAVLDLIEFQGDLYAATMSRSRYTGSGDVYRYDGETNWTLVWTPPSNYEYQVCDLEVWNGDLYAGTAGNGGKLYRYNAGTDSFDYVGTVPDTDSGGRYHRWYGIRSMYPWSHTGDLHLGDHGYDCLGRYDGTNLIHDAYMGGSCIYDFAEFNGKLYACAYAGRLLWSSTGVGRSWSWAYFTGSYIWEVESFQGYLYTGNYGGRLASLDTSHNYHLVWSSGSSYQQIISMIADEDDEDSVLYFGTGGEAGYVRYSSGAARVYAYYGSATPVEIFDADGGDTGGTDHAGIQCLYLPEQAQAVRIVLGMPANLRE